jgi:branched-chain amino acid transport system ATP-binding protein
LKDLFGEVLVDNADQIAGSMSGGQRQMLAIAVALARRPTVLLLDEPSTGLAPMIVERILRVVETLVKTTPTSVILVEQNLSNALKVSSRAVVVQSGSIAAEFARDEFPDPTELWHYF